MSTDVTTKPIASNVNIIPEVLELRLTFKTKRALYYFITEFAKEIGSYPFLSITAFGSKVRQNYHVTPFNMRQVGKTIYVCLVLESPNWGEKVGKRIGCQHVIEIIPLCQELRSIDFL
jgi:hypothetical protein